MRALFAGTAASVVLGLMLGGAMQPVLAGDDRPAGPQMFTGWSAARSTGPFDSGSSYASYGGQIPAYVTGTDYTQTAYYETPPVVQEQPRRAVHDDPPPAPVELTHATYEDAPPAVVVYPSLEGGRAFGDDDVAAPPDEEATTQVG